MEDVASFEALSGFTRALSVALHERDPYTRFHCDRVDLLACELGIACGLSATDITMLRISSVLHDIGKIGIPDSVLLKPASLDQDEWEAITTHSIRGQRIACATQLPNAEQIGTVIRHHHEYFNGAGYPDGLAGESIPLLSRILSIADSYDAMATPRIYQRARNHDEIMEILRTEENIKFDPFIFRKFAEVIERSSCRA
ncbi:MAG: HD domain-containing protein [Sulfuritalea sp.]|jgi:HD-GYP domain-containing protein (c-di-GMP phosphodiesterase class II)|nr:HD domain-containing protein [Sulfuritalea sp.]